MKNNYDVVIIGAGLSGLVAGCYLVREGLRVAIIEQHHSVGGYCTSFRRKNFIFDSAIHSLGSCRNDGQFGRIFKDFNFDVSGFIKRADPSDIVCLGGENYTIRGDVEDIVDEFQSKFPDEKEKIRIFFETINGFNINSAIGSAVYFKKFGNKTFSSYLDTIFKGEKIKEVISTFLGNTGLPADYVSCLNAFGLIKEFILDGGYYAVGGLQNLSNMFMAYFENNGGKMYLGKPAQEIKTKNKKVEGVLIDNGEYLSASFVVSAGDATNLYTNLLSPEDLDVSMSDKIRLASPSVSIFMVYLGLKGNINEGGKARAVWYLSEKQRINDFYRDSFNNTMDIKNEFVLCTFPSRYDGTLCPPDCSTVQLYVTAPFISDSFWQDKKKSVCDELISRAAKYLPGLEEKIIVKEAASPLTLKRYTLNSQGAAFGWASTLEQCSNTLFPNRCNTIENLYFSGHWTTFGAGQGGTPMVVYSGRRTAKGIIKKFNKEKKKIL